MTVWGLTFLCHCDDKGWGLYTWSGMLACSSSPCERQKGHDFPQVVRCPIPQIKLSNSRLVVWLYNLGQIEHQCICMCLLAWFVSSKTSQALRLGRPSACEMGSMGQRYCLGCDKRLADAKALWMTSNPFMLQVVIMLTMLIVHCVWLRTWVTISFLVRTTWLL